MIKFKNKSNFILIVILLTFIIFFDKFAFATQIIEPKAPDTIDIDKMTINSEVDLSKYFGLDVYNDEVSTVIEEFINKYITNNMSDFEKEIKIIQYIVENVDYDYENLLNDTTENESYTIYGALIKHRAVCAGYASAFDVMCKAVGIESKIITGSASNNINHAWNQIKLDDEWYNVDVTFEDAIINNSTNNGYGFNKLRNKYINRTNFEFNKDHIWEKAENADSTDYGPDRVRYYLITGREDNKMSLDDYRKMLFNQTKPVVEKIQNGYSVSLELNSELINIGPKLDDDTNYIESLDLVNIADYINKSLNNSIDKIYICYDKSLDMSSVNREWLESVFTNIKNFAVFNYQIKNSYDSYLKHNEFNLIVIIPNCIPI